MHADTSKLDPDAPQASTMSAAVDGLRHLLGGRPTLAAAHGIPDTALDSIYGVGRELYANGHHAEALRSFEMLCLYDHRNARNWQALGVCRQTLQDYSGAAEALAFAVGQAAVPDPAVQVHLVECLIAAGALEAAEDALVALGEGTPLDEPLTGKVRFLQAHIQERLGGRDARVDDAPNDGSTRS